MNRQQQSEIYRSYCNAIALVTGAKGQELSERIAEANRQAYYILFNSRSIRQRNMTQQQLIQLVEHRQQVTSVMVMKAALLNK